MDSEVRILQLSTGIAVPCLLQDEPDAKPLLLLHAWGESSRSFDRLVPLLPEFRIAAPDLRGHGDADKPDNGYSLEDQAADAAAILDALQLESAAVLGSSSGGYVAQQLAVLDPDRVDALVLVGAPLSLHGRPSFADEVEALAGPLDEDWVRRSLLWFPLGRPVPQWYLEDRVRDGVRMPVHVWKDALQGLYRATPPTEAGAISAPALILRGEQDELLPRAGHETLRHGFRAQS
ncbi:pimeloyl-ACP methyl ester carboxylesterase [Arthrobacter sp. SLBN-100]|uniref:alpha/beta fold hydrolase n=1 Tax=Arthrobacter sp. SLBN-100 TaxID=2768450 RepID=UPI0011757E80|nr:alpha/beta fold hydrolase [Arthrobacter sp. SLBN-100]TQJ67599.1 pimeloyl-ACP methyl ester carboxylesterase [Arthrobacter sp. SLBN-100]